MRITKIMKIVLIALLIGATGITASAKRKPAQIQIVDATGSDDRGIQNLLIKKHAVESVRAVIEQQHVRLSCSEKKGCDSLAPGAYQGIVDDKSGSVWITATMPVTNRTVKDHYLVRGSW